ncbi:hypothetical protein [Candidatus Methanoperedens nitratireducens]|uniref:Uncharacterized protein n=1 Tax=Candidatus Methanoperedens nitratireducens TaxID=1392998 RepID=A0A284VTK4_9EURY|nr:hypothetical protein [Candidatus Methanoperedens nitroreducens]SNQ62624.1 membrane hypothetical protein [Candidatus Methanoperedens nitroreducens]
MDNIYLFTVRSSSSVIAALIGLYFVLRIWLKWNNIDIDVLKARVFLNKNFITKNWIHTFLSGAFLASHQFIDLLQSLNYIAKTGWVYQLSDILEFTALVFLVILAYEWFVMIFPRK